MRRPEIYPMVGRARSKPGKDEPRSRAYPRDWAWDAAGRLAGQVPGPAAAALIAGTVHL